VENRSKWKGRKERGEVECVGMKVRKNRSRGGREKERVDMRGRGKKK
jgi:hypothetical protein